jgi:hypothetical protein
MIDQDKSTFPLNSDAFKYSITSSFCPNSGALKINNTKKKKYFIRRIKRVKIPFLVNP